MSLTSLEIGRRARDRPNLTYFSIWRKATSASTSASDRWS
jgi:hypothetical protein